MDLCQFYSKKEESGRENASEAGCAIILQSAAAAGQESREAVWSLCKLSSAGQFILAIVLSEEPLLGAWALVPGRPKQQSAFKLVN